MINKYFHKYLINLGFSDEELLSFTIGNIFSYSPYKKISPIKYILISNKDEIFYHHLKLWNINNDNVFIAVDNEKSYIIDCKKKPEKGVINSIESFDYGINSKGYEEVDINLISKSYIDSSYFYKFIEQKQRKKQEVDKDLLLNLIALRNDLLVNGNEKIIHLLILRCLFVKYLEDRGIFSLNYLSNILLSKSPTNLISAFGEVCKINGDVFGNSKLSVEDINEGYLDKLYLFFSADYQSGQGSLFPYQFDNIPIQLISHVYEAFLNNNTKKGKGVYYTPAFVVNFMLSQSLKEKVKKNPYLTVFDPAVGSGAFLVESFKIIRDAQYEKLKRNLSYNEKKQILENQLWGVDVDGEALQITAFSLYLALLEDESPEFIQNKIEHSHPILPSLIGRMLMNANTIVDNIFDGQKFDFIVSNPPWGSVPDDKQEEHLAERKAIDNKSGLYSEYNNVADYERSQAFLRRIERWQKPDTTIVMIVKNSIFLNDKAIGFRQEFIDKNKLQTFYELSNYNKILFKKKVFKSAKVNIEIGASEPCAIVIFKPNPNNVDYKINYIAPKLTKLGEHFEIIQYTSNESFLIDKSEFIENDNLWKVLVKSDFEGYKLLEKIKTRKDKSLEIVCSKGFEPQPNKENDNEEKLVEVIMSKDLTSFKILNRKYFIFNVNQKLRRTGNKELYLGERILISTRPKPSDNFRLRSAFVTANLYFRNDIFGFKVLNSRNIKSYVGLLNSSLFGFYFYLLSAQWFGGAKRDALRKSEVLALPFINLDSESDLKTEFITYMEQFLSTPDVEKIKKLDEIVFNLYGLTEYEKEIIKEFYQINVERADEKLKYVQPRDVKSYFKAFKETLELVLSPNHTINASFSISQNIGAIIKISIKEKNTEKEIEQDNNLHVLQFVKNKQLSETDKLFKEEKIKLYEPTHFYLIKSNQFKDWTKRQAYKDAKEEIDLLFSKLPDTDE